MQKTFVVLTIIVCVLTEGLTPQESIDICSDSENGFNRFKTAFGKSYATIQEEQNAQTAFQECCEAVLAASADPSRTFTSSLHAKCDISLSSITSNPLYIPPGNPASPPQPTAPTVGFSALVGSSCPPNYKDDTTTPKDQGSCGACWAFCTTAAYETHWNRMNGQLLDLSEEYVLECTAPYNSSATPYSTCAGGIIDYALAMIVNTGIAKESQYPYAGYSFGGSGTPSTISNCGNTADFTVIKFPSNGSNALWYRYDNITSSQIQTLLDRGSLMVTIYADSNLYAYSSGVFTCSVDFNTAFSNINHAVELVGMDCSGNYIIKNSWGTSWGEGGYATVSPTSDCGISAYVYQLLWAQSLTLSLALLIIFISI